MGAEEPWPGANADTPHEGAAPLGADGMADERRSHEEDVPAEMVGTHGERQYPDPLEVQQAEVKLSQQRIGSILELCEYVSICMWEVIPDRPLGP